MEQQIIITRKQYVTETEDENISKLKMDFRDMHFSTYDPFRKYLHIQVGEYDDFNFYLEMSSYEAEKMFLALAKKVGKMARGY
jgi:hypothetical protein